MPILATLIALQAAAQPAPAPAPLPPATVAPAAAIPSPRPPLTAPPPAAARRALALAAVRAEWPRYDGGAKGRLTPSEFSRWVLRSHNLAVSPAGTHAPGIPEIKAINLTSAAFALADANHDGGVTQEEMAAFLTR